MEITSVSNTSETMANDPTMIDIVNYADWALRVFFGLLIFGGNGLTIFVIFRFNELWTSSNVLIAGLACADFLSSFVPVFKISLAFINPFESYRRLLCLILETINLVSTLTNMIFIVLISFDRYLYIFKPLKYYILFPPRRAFLLQLLLCVILFQYVFLE